MVNPKATLEQLFENTRMNLKDSPDTNSETAKVILPVISRYMSDIITSDIQGLTQPWLCDFLILLMLQFLR